MKMEHKAAYIAGGATIVAALVAALLPVVFNVESKPNAAIGDNSSNNNVVQGAAGDVTINQKVNELGEIRGLDADAMKQSLVSGCETLNDYFVTERNFDVDSIDTLIGDAWVRKQQFISYFGAEEHRRVMDLVDEFQPLYIEYIPGLYWFSERGEVFKNQQTAATDGALGDEQYAKMDAMYRARMDAAKPALVDVTGRLCERFRNLSYIKK